MIRVVVAVQLWLRNVAVYMALCRSRTIVVGGCHCGHDVVSDVEMPICSNRGRNDDSSGDLRWSGNSLTRDSTWRDKQVYPALKIRGLLVG